MSAVEFPKRVLHYLHVMSLHFFQKENGERQDSTCSSHCHLLPVNVNYGSGCFCDESMKLTSVYLHFPLWKMVWRPSHANQLVQVCPGNQLNRNNLKRLVFRKRYSLYPGKWEHFEQPESGSFFYGSFSLCMGSCSSWGITLLPRGWRRNSVRKCGRRDTHDNEAWVTKCCSLRESCLSFFFILCLLPPEKATLLTLHRWHLKAVISKSSVFWKTKYSDLFIL